MLPWLRGPVRQPLRRPRRRPPGPAGDRRGPRPVAAASAAVPTRSCSRAAAPRPTTWPSAASTTRRPARWRAVPSSTRPSSSPSSHRRAARPCPSTPRARSTSTPWRGSPRHDPRVGHDRQQRGRRRPAGRPWSPPSAGRPRRRSTPTPSRPPPGSTWRRRRPRRPRVRQRPQGGRATGAWARSSSGEGRRCAQALGGGQERELRSGTHNVAGIVGWPRPWRAAAADRDDRAERVAKLRDRLAEGLLATIHGAAETARAAAGRRRPTCSRARCT